MLSILAGKTLFSREKARMPRSYERPFGAGAQPEGRGGMADQRRPLAVRFEHW